MKITMLIHPDSWLKYDLAVNFMPIFLKHADINDISFPPKPTIPGDVLFALHYPALIPPNLFHLHKHNVVIHGADLPEGRGRAPVHWQVEAGRCNIPLTMFEMGAGADDGPVYMRRTLRLDSTELLDDIRLKFLKVESEMIDTFLRHYPMTAYKQYGAPKYYPRRCRDNQKLDPTKTIAEQFDKMRVADNERYPLWFEHRGEIYVLKIYSQAPKLKLFKRDLDPQPPQGFTG